MDRYRVSLEGDDLVFSAAHFLVFGDGESEALHGHDYRVRVELTGPLDSDGLVYDFVELRRRLRRRIEALDHRVLLAESSAALDVAQRHGEIRVSHGERSYRLPAGDVALLPIANTSTELLAGYLAGRIAEDLRARAPRIEEVRVEIEEAPGQTASVTRTLDETGP